MSYKDKEKQRAYQAKRYLAKREEYVAAGQRTKKRRRAWIADQKKKPCADCGILYPFYVMEFDHVSGDKLFRLNQGYRFSYDLIREEIEKCEVVCSNCHRERTHRRKNTP